jgi:hypothetical protein
MLLNKNLVKCFHPLNLVTKFAKMYLSNSERQNKFNKSYSRGVSRPRPSYRNKQDPKEVNIADRSVSYRKDFTREREERTEFVRDKATLNSIICKFSS